MTDLEHLERVALAATPKTAVETLRAMAVAEAAKGHVHTAHNFDRAADAGEANAAAYIAMVSTVGKAAKAILDREGRAADRPQETGR